MYSLLLVYSGAEKTRKEEQVQYLTPKRKKRRTRRSIENHAHERQQRETEADTYIRRTDAQNWSVQRVSSTGFKAVI